MPGADFDRRRLTAILITRFFADGNMVFPLAPALESSSPQIRKAVVITHNQSHILSYKDGQMKKNGYNVSEHFFDYRKKVEGANFDCYFRKPTIHR